MKNYDELTSEVLEKVRSEKKRRRGAVKKITSAALAFVFVAGAVLAAYYSGGMTRSVVPDVKGAVVASAHDYGEIYDLLIKAPDGDYPGYGEIETDMAERVDEKTSLSEVSDAPANDASPELSAGTFTRTNVQVDGIDEADVVKTDGKYVYAVSRENVYIISAENGEMNSVSKVPYRGEDGSFTPDASLAVTWAVPDIYIEGDRLIIVSHTYRYNGDNGQNDPVYIMPFYGGDSYFTAAVYDISDRSSPAFVSSVSVSGEGISSRMTDGRLYLIAADRYYGELDRSEPETFIPSVYEDGKSELIAPDSIYCGAEESTCQYLNVMEVSVADASVVSSISLLGYDGETMYQSADNIFVARTDYKYDSTETTEDGITTAAGSNRYDTILTKISLNGGLAFAGAANLDGSILNSFSMDEYDGYLRVVTSIRIENYESKWREAESFPENVDYDVPENRDGDIVYAETGSEEYYGEYYYYGPEYISDEWNDEMYNNLYVLDSAMNVTGRLERLAPDERIYSCRFEGTDGYFVTYRETDPLFHVDLSDPTAPRVIDELKIPGHSDYLGRFGELLFGFGQDDDGNLKLSMFSEDEGGAMSEISVITIPGAYYSEALYDHHAILADAERGLICFGAETWGDDDVYGSKFYVVSWNGQGFEIKTSVDIGEWSDALRGLFIGDFFYLFARGSGTADTITSFSLTDFSEIDREELDEREIEPDYYGVFEGAIID
ncbi:MAG: beta-propeller domain-containing protein [Clostridia bacterium]|nr:beta-propeller domain-containing protein [Clostridia bacterium]